MEDHQTQERLETGDLPGNSGVVPVRSGVWSNAGQGGDEFRVLARIPDLICRQDRAVRPVDSKQLSPNVKKGRRFLPEGVAVKLLLGTGALIAVVAVSTWLFRGDTSSTTEGSPGLDADIAPPFAGGSIEESPLFPPPPADQGLPEFGVPSSSIFGSGHDGGTEEGIARPRDRSQLPAELTSGTTDISQPAEPSFSEPSRTMLAPNPPIAQQRAEDETRSGTSDPAWIPPNAGLNHNSAPQGAVSDDSQACPQGELSGGSFPPVSSNASPGSAPIQPEASVHRTSPVVTPGLARLGTTIHYPPHQDVR